MLWVLPLINQKVEQFYLIARTGFVMYVFPSNMEVSPDAILFDFDGVLVNSEPLHFRALQKTAESFDLKLTEDQYYDELLGYDDRGAFKRLLELNQKPLDKPLLLKMIAAKQKVAEELIFDKQYEALEGVEEVVRALWRNYPLAICSGAMGSEIELMLDGIRLRDCFRVIVSAEDVTVGKPDPECYLRGVELLSRKYHKRINARNCIVIEDAPRVLDRLKPLGFQCVGIASHTPAERFDGAAAILNSLNINEFKQKLPHVTLFEA